VPKPGERLPGPGSAEPIARDGPQGAALDAVAAIRTVEAEEDGAHQHCASEPSGPVLLSVQDGAGALGGPPMAEPGAGSAGRGAAGTALITYGSTRQYGYRPATGLGYRPGKRKSRAGDGNRTRAISLGIYRLHPKRAP
jgi:hypothetical protein